MSAKKSQHICVVHGYILAGTGSNIYSVNLAMTWKKQGHAVTAVCQDREAASYDYVDEFFLGTDNIPSTPPPPGTLRVVVPDIDDLLPVYVFDKYEGYTVKTIPDCTEAEIENHITKTAAGIKRVLAQGVDRVLSNHALLSPVNAKRACEEYGVPFDIKIHGSGITFVLKPHPRYKKYTIEAIEACEKVVCGTQYIVDYMKETFKDEYEALELESKMVIVPPGMDPDVFDVAESHEANQRRFREKVAKFIESSGSKGRDASKITLPPVDAEDMHAALTAVGDTYDQRSVDADLLDRFPTIGANEPVIMYFGKFLNTKGVGEVIATFPQVLKEVPNARLLLVGFGGFREHIEGMLSAMANNDVDAFVAYGKAGPSDGAPFLDPSEDDLRKLFMPLSGDQRSRVTVTGILKHEQLGELLPIASIVVVGSKAAEAFGMVTVEAMSAGVLPLSNDHSGLSDVLHAVNDARPDLCEVMKLDTRGGGSHGTADGAYFCEILPSKIVAALKYMYPSGFDDQARRVELAQELRAVVVKKFAWDGLCTDLLRPLSPRRLTVAASALDITVGAVVPGSDGSKTFKNKYSGTLNKKGKYLNSWKRRWFVLARNGSRSTLSYYLSEENMKLKGSHDLTGAVLEVWPHDNMMKDFGFVVRFADRKAQVLTLFADSIEEKEEWVDHLVEFIH
jgi:glycosyltransferase involved in cell wall biosynthesis